MKATSTKLIEKQCQTHLANQGIIIKGEISTSASDNL